MSIGHDHVSKGAYMKIVGERGPEIAMTDVMRRVTIVVKVTGIRRGKVRNWLGVKLMELAAVVFGCSVEVDIQSD